MVRRLLSVVVVIAVVACALALIHAPSLRPAALASSSQASPEASPQASPQASPATSPVVSATVSSGEATIAAMQTQVVAMSNTATAEAAIQATIAALSTQSASIAQTATAASAPSPTETPTPEPTATPTGTPTPTPLPEAGDVLYQTGEDGFKEWGASGSWKYLNGMLLTDGSGMVGTDYYVIASDSYLPAPYVPGTITDYAVEAEIQFVNVNDASCPYVAFGIVVRSSDTGSYLGAVSPRDDCGPVAAITAVAPGSGALLESASFDPGTEWHTYRLEVKGNTIRMLIDGTEILSTTDNRFLDGDSVGLFCSNIQIQVRSFKIIAL